MARPPTCNTHPMISVVIPTLNAEQGLAHSLSALVPAVVSGLIRELIITDGSSTDHTKEIALEAGATFIDGPPGRGLQLVAGAKAARGEWLLFLHADTVLEPGWDDEVQNFIEKIANGQRKQTAAAFRFALDDDGTAPRILESMVRFRSNLLRVPYGDQGLLISRNLFDEIGGYRPIEIMEDLDIIMRLGRRRITVLRSRAITCAGRYRKHGYLTRIARNQTCLVMYMFGVPVSRIAQFYFCKDSRE